MFFIVVDDGWSFLDSFCGSFVLWSYGCGMEEGWNNYYGEGWCGLNSGLVGDGVGVIVCNSFGLEDGCVFFRVVFIIGRRRFFGGGVVFVVVVIVSICCFCGWWGRFGGGIIFVLFFGEFGDDSVRNKKLSLGVKGSGVEE